MKAAPRALSVALAITVLGACSSTSYRFTGSIDPSTGSFATSTADLGPIPSVKKVLPGIEKFVEQERGLKFKHPVKVKLLGSKAFVKKLDKGDKPPSKKDIDQEESVLASTGLVSPKVDLAKAFKAANDAGTIGFYDFKTKRLYVRGTQATPGVRAVMSHELTHALTDQWFGLSRPKLAKSNQELDAGFTALIEGDAERTRMAYEAQVLTPAQRKVAEQEENSGGTPPNIPSIVLELIGFPYAIGPDFVDAIVADGGIKALNRAYRHPPVSSEQLLNPVAYEKHDNPKHVATPTADRSRVAHGDLGAIGLLLMFERGLSRDQALQALDGWGGDQFASWRAGKRKWCLRDSVVMDSGAAMSSFQSGLKAWAGSRNGKVHIEHLGSTTTFTTCGSASSGSTDNGGPQT